MTDPTELLRREAGAPGLSHLQGASSIPMWRVGKR